MDSIDYNEGLFTGSANIAFDEKHRMGIPKKLQDAFHEKVYILENVARSSLICAPKAIEEVIPHLPFPMAHGHSSAIVKTNDHRFLLPPNLFKTISDEEISRISLVGRGKYIEIFSPKTWEAVRASEQAAIQRALDSREP